MKDFFKLNRLVVLFIAFGLMVLAFEVYLQHYLRLSQKSIMWLPIIFGIVGGFLTLLIVIIFNNLCYYLFILLMTCSMVVGTLGLYFHNRWRFPEIVGYLFHGKPFDFETLITFTPPLAPSAFIAMGGLGILIAIFEGWLKVEKNTEKKKVSE